MGIQVTVGSAFSLPHRSWMPPAHETHQRNHDAGTCKHKGRAAIQTKFHQPSSPSCRSADHLEPTPYCDPQGPTRRTPRSSRGALKEILSPPSHLLHRHVCFSLAPPPHRRQPTRGSARPPLGCRVRPTAEHLSASRSGSEESEGTEACGTHRCPLMETNSTPHKHLVGRLPPDQPCRPVRSRDEWRRAFSQASLEWTREQIFHASLVARALSLRRRQWWRRRFGEALLCEPGRGTAGLPAGTPAFPVRAGPRVESKWVKVVTGWRL